MPTVAAFDGIKIQFYWDEHPPPHFHAEFAEYRAMIDRSNPGIPAPNATDQSPLLGGGSRRCLAVGVDEVPVGQKSGADRMKRKLPRIVSAEPVIHGVLKIIWTDRYVGLVDLRPIIARGRIFDYLRKPGNFQKVRVTEFGHSIEWIDDKGSQIDFGADALRDKAEKQAALIALAS